MPSWKCQLCLSRYASLYELVSHVRGSHSKEANLHFVCGVKLCSKSFKNTNSWYKHVIKIHSEHYFKVSPAQSRCSESHAYNNLLSSSSLGVDKSTTIEDDSEVLVTRSSSDKESVEPEFYM